jgi:hypothetical protein
MQRIKLTPKAQAQSQVSSCGIRGGHIVNRQDFLRLLQFSLSVASINASTKILFFHNPRYAVVETGSISKQNTVTKKKQDLIWPH